MYVHPRLQTLGGLPVSSAPRPNEAPPIGVVALDAELRCDQPADQQVADLWAYIRTFKPTQPPLKDIPLLEQMLKEGGKLKSAVAATTVAIQVGRRSRRLSGTRRSTSMTTWFSSWQTSATISDELDAAAVRL
jgi:hypothetical protein